MEQVLPHDLEAERAVLGSILISSSVWAIAASRLRAADLFRDAHRIIFQAMGEVVASATPIDFVTLKSELLRRGQLDEVGGPTYIASLTDGVPMSAHVEYYCGIVREHARRRAAILASNRIAIEAYDAEQPAARTIEHGIEQLLAAIDAPSTGLISADEAVRAYGEALDNGTLGDPLMTGHVDVDALMGGMRPTDLVIVAARPSTGKTSWALGVGQHLASQGLRTVFFSIEMGQHRLAARLLAWRSQVPTDRFERGLATEEEFARVAMAVADSIGPLLIETTARTVAEIGAWCRRAKQDGGLACAIIDYVQLLSAERRRESAEAEMAGISAALKQLAKEIAIPVIAISQLNRAPENRRDKRPHPADLRGSGAWEQDADIIVLLHRQEMYDRKPENVGIAEVIIGKNRNGPTGTMRLQFTATLAQFHDLAPGA